MNKATVLQVMGASLPIERMVVADQTTDDIIELIADKHPRTYAEYDRIAYLFDGGTLEDICRRLFNFCKQEIAYKEETVSRQDVSAPQTILQRGHSDCKGYALFIGGVLDALQRQGLRVKWFYRFVGYDVFKSRVHHVFVVVKDQGREIWIDPVLNSFNYHKPYWVGEDVTVYRSAGAVGSVGEYWTEDESVDDDGAVGVPWAMAAAQAAQALPALVQTFQMVFGSGYKTSTGVRWLTYFYQRSVLNQITDFKKVNEGLTGDAQTWFYGVLGVPIYDKFRYHVLSGTSDSTGWRLNPFPSDDARAKKYLQFEEVVNYGVTYADALAAAKIAAALPLRAGDLGLWRNVTLSPSFLQKMQAQAQGVTQVQQQATINPAVVPSGAQIIPGISNTVLIAAAAVVAFVLLND